MFRSVGGLTSKYPRCKCLCPTYELRAAPLGLRSTRSSLPNIANTSAGMTGGALLSVFKTGRNGRIERRYFTDANLTFVDRRQGFWARVGVKSSIFWVHGFMGDGEKGAIFSECSRVFCFRVFGEGECWRMTNVNAVFVDIKNVFFWWIEGWPG